MVQKDLSQNPHSLSAMKKRICPPEKPIVEGSQSKVLHKTRTNGDFFNHHNADIEKSSPRRLIPANEKQMLGRNPLRNDDIDGS